MTPEKQEYSAKSIKVLEGLEAVHKAIPFEFTIKLPPPLKRGVDYGFKPLATYRN